MSKPRIVVVGGGAGGLPLVTQLGRKLGKYGRADITLVDPSNMHVWKPRFHEVATGAIDADPATGWGIHPERDIPHQGVFSFAEPISTPGGAHLLIRMSQPYGSGHVIRHFRFSLTDSEGEIRWIDLPDGLQAALAKPQDERSAEALADLHARFMKTVPELAKKIRMSAARDIAQDIHSAWPRTNVLTRLATILVEIQ